MFFLEDTSKLHYIIECFVNVSTKTQICFNYKDQKKNNKQTNIQYCYILSHLSQPWDEFVSVLVWVSVRVRASPWWFLFLDKIYQFDGHSTVSLCPEQNNQKQRCPHISNYHIICLIREKKKIETALDTSKGSVSLPQFFAYAILEIHVFR